MRECRELWREHIRALAAARETLACVQACSPDLAGVLLWSAFLLFMRDLLTQRRWYRRYLRARWGLVVRPRGRSYLLRRARPPRTLHELGERTAAIQIFAMAEMAWNAY